MATVFEFSQPSILATVTAVTFRKSLHQAATSTTIRGSKLTALVDSCSDDSYIDEDVARALKLQVHQIGKNVTHCEIIVLNLSRLYQYRLDSILINRLTHLYVLD